jgi:signal transduction histidine kinase
MSQSATGPTDHAGTLDLSGDENFFALADASRDFVCTATLDGEIRFVNVAARQALGLSDSVALPAAMAGYVDADDHALVSSLLVEVVTQGHGQTARLKFKHQPTGRSVTLSCQLFRLKRRHSTEALTAAIIGRDVAASPEPQAVGAQDATAMTRLSEMFAGIVGHDLRNPLNAILTCAHYVTETAPDEMTKKTLGRIVSSGHRMQRMIDQLLDLTRIRSGGGIPLQISPVDLNALAQQGIQEVSAAHPDCEFRFNTAGDANGFWDADRIAQLISNLLGNAAQHGDRDDCVDVTIDGTAPEALTVVVRNKGVIPPEFVPVLFNPFRILHQKRHKSMGLGLGLYVSRQIALAHGGDIDVTSTADSGTTFRVRLPRQPFEVQPLPAASSGLGAEDMAILEMLSTAPKSTSVTAQLFGVVALHERAPQEYWRLFERYARLLDLALDHQTYKMDGQQLSDELREIAEQLGRLGAGAREVAELHARALRQKTRTATVVKSQAFTAEGRLVSFELMGHLLSFYRRRSGLGG